MEDFKTKDDLNEQKTPFIDKAVGCAELLGKHMTPLLIGGEIKRSAFIVALEDIGKPQHQIVIAGMGSNRCLEMAAEALVNHPQFGHLFVAKVMERVIASGELTAQIVEIPKPPKGGVNLN